MKIAQLIGAVLLLTSVSSAFAQNQQTAQGLHAEIKTALTGPTQISEGSVGTFSLKLDYLPKDLSHTFGSIENVPNSLSYVNMYYGIEYLGYSIYQGQNQVGPTYLYPTTQHHATFYGGSIPGYAFFNSWGYIDPSSPRTIYGNDPDEAYSETLSFSLPTLGVGTYKIETFARFWVEIYHAPNVECLKNIDEYYGSPCAPGGMISNYADADDVFVNRNHELEFSVVAVPEPESYALMLAGLGLVSAVARRRKVKQTQ